MAKASAAYAALFVPGLPTAARPPTTAWIHLPVTPSSERDGAAIHGQTDPQ